MPPRPSSVNRTTADHSGTEAIFVVLLVACALTVLCTAAFFYHRCTAGLDDQRPRLCRE